MLAERRALCGSASCLLAGCRCVRAASEQWYKCDDANITRAEQAEVLAQEAYLLFYIRESCD